MRYLKKMKLAAMTLTLIAFVGQGSASATVLEVGGEPKSESVSLSASLKSGTSTSFETTAGSLQGTCTGSEVKGSTTSPFSGEKVHGNLSTLNWSGCTDTLHTVAPGSFTIEHVGAGTNGTVRLTGAKWELESTNFGATLECTTNNTDVGTLEGVKEGHATLHVNAVINCGFFVPSMKWQATYTVTSPTGLGISA